MKNRRRWQIGGSMAAGVIATLLVLFAIGTARAKTGVVTTKDGQRIEGDVTENDQEVVIDIHGVKTHITRDNVATLVYSDTFDKQFQDRLATLDPKDVRGRLDLAKWAIDQKQYDAARTAVDQAQAMDPNNREAFDLQNLIRSQARLDRASRAPSTGPGSSAPPVPAGGIAPADRKLLSATDINTIRQLELKPGDTGVRINFTNDVKNRFVKFRNIQLSEFNALKPVDQALRIIKEGDPSFCDDVKIMGDPASIVEYKRTIQPNWVVNGCAAANCHGGTKAGGFMVYVPPENDAVSYTNFYILSTYARRIGESTTGGVFGGAVERRMIDRSKPPSSLLLQYGLPINVSEYDHPNVAGYDGVVRTREDPRYRTVANWIEHSLTPVQPDYGIRYDAPGAPTTTPAAPAPATATSH